MVDGRKAEFSAMPKHNSEMRLYSTSEERLYLNRSEREMYKKSALQQSEQTRLLCLILFYTGCRISEALNISWSDIQWDEGIIAIRSLKKRDKHHVREVPVPPELIMILKSRYQKRNKHTVFQHDRTTGWRRITETMKTADIIGIHATPKGLRHSFAMWCAYNGIPITLCQKWMGHSDIRTTAIYYQIVGKEEIELAEKLWG